MDEDKEIREMLLQAHESFVRLLKMFGLDEHSERALRSRIAELETENRLLKMQLDQFQTGHMRTLFQRKAHRYADFQQQVGSLESDEDQVDLKAFTAVKADSVLSCPKCQQEYSAQDGVSYSRHVNECCLPN